MRPTPLLVVLLAACTSQDAEQPDPDTDTGEITDTDTGPIDTGEETDTADTDTDTDTGADTDTDTDTAPPGCAAILEGVEYDTVQGAVDVAAEGAVVTVCAGTWGPVVLPRSMSLIAAEGASATLDGAGGGATVRVLAGNVTLAGLTLTGGIGTWRADPGGGSEAFYGGAVDAIDADALTLEGCTIADNVADFGGGVYGPASGAMVVRATTFSGNEATLGGGGLYFRGVSLAIEGSEFVGNAAGSGGGARLHHVAEAAVESTTFSGNAAEEGGGLYVRGSNPPTERVAFSNVSVTANEATDQGGGAYLGYLDQALLVGTTIGSNTSAAGGGLYVSSASVTLDAKSSVSLNHAIRGGGVVVSQGVLDGGLVQGNTGAHGAGVYLRGPVTDLRNTTVRENTASSFGGGVYFWGDQGLIVGCQIQENSSRYGGGLAFDTASESNEVRDTTVSWNEGTFGGGFYGLEAAEGSFYDSVFEDNVAEYGGGLFLDIATLTLVDVSVQRNSARSVGGGALINSTGGRLVSVSSDWGSGADENLAADVDFYLGLSYLDYGEAENFACEGGVCE